MKPFASECKVVYYEGVKVGKRKRLAKVTATLRMISNERGIVTKCSVEKLDKYRDYEIPDSFKIEQIGKQKNLCTCYEIDF